MRKSFFAGFAAIPMLLVLGLVAEPVAGVYNSNRTEICPLKSQIISSDEHSFYSPIFRASVPDAAFPSTEISGDNATEDDLIDYSKIPLLKWVGPGEPGTYEEYLQSHPKQPLKVELLKAVTGTGISLPESTPCLLFIVTSSLYSKIQPRFDRYLTDVQSLGYTVEFYLYESGTAESLKSYINEHSENLAGCVFVGGLPSAWFEIANDYDELGYAEFPCDLFFMDLDGAWEDVDGNGRYDSHSAGSGDEGPEIFLARIDASPLPGDEASLINSYLDKLHDYYVGATRHTRYGLTYTEDDWAGHDGFEHDIGYLYSNYDAIAAPDTSRDDYRDERLTNTTYEFIQLACHSSSRRHWFNRGGALYSSDVKGIPPRALLYNLFSCSANRFTDDNYLGGAYIFNSSDTALAVVGSTKAGSMLLFERFYKPLAEGKTFGQAFKEWFNSLAPYSDNEIYWHFGMCILGDPLIHTFSPVDQHELIVSEVSAPSDILPSAETTIEAVVENCGASDEVAIIVQLLIDSTVVDSMTIAELPSMRSRAIDFIWTPSECGKFDATVYAVPVEGEANIENNAVTTSINVHAVYITEVEAPREVPEDETFTLSVYVSNNGDYAVTGASATIDLPAGLSTDESLTKPINTGMIEPGQSATVEWVINADQAGEHLIDIAVESSNGGSDEGQVAVKVTGECFIFTATYGSPMASQVKLLQYFRGEIAAKTEVGSEFFRVFNNIYYSFSPQVAEIISSNELIRSSARFLVTPLVAIACTAQQTMHLASDITGDEAGMLVSLLICGLLAGVIYIAPLVTAVSIIPRKYRKVKAGKRVAFTEVGLLSLLFISLVLCALGGGVKGPAAFSAVVSLCFLASILVIHAVHNVVRGKQP